MFEVSSGIGISHDLYTKDANLLKVQTIGINGNVNYSYAATSFKFNAIHPSIKV